MQIVQSAQKIVRKKANARLGKADVLAKKRRKVAACAVLEDEPDVVPRFIPIEKPQSVSMPQFVPVHEIQNERAITFARSRIRREETGQHCDTKRKKGTSQDLNLVQHLVHSPLVAAFHRNILDGCLSPPLVYGRGFAPTQLLVNVEVVHGPWSVSIF